MPKWFSQSSDSNVDLTPLLDSLYRISVPELQSVLNRHYSISLKFAVQEVENGKSTGSTSDPLVLIGDPTSQGHGYPSIRGETPLTSKLLPSKELQISYASPKQKFILVLAGEDRILADWHNLCRTTPYAVSGIFLYVFNRYRALETIESEASAQRTLLDELYRDLRTPGREFAAIASVAVRLGFSCASCFLYGIETDLLAPVASAKQDGSPLDMIPVRAAEMPFWESISRQRAVVDIELPLEYAGDHYCNCIVMQSMGMKQAVFVPIGHERLGEDTDLPRGVLSLYRDASSPITDFDKTLLSAVARELAAWIDERDEELEHRILRNSIQSAFQLCATGFTQSISKATFVEVLKHLGRFISEAVHDSSSGLHNVDSTGVECAYASAGRQVGHMPASVATAASEHVKSGKKRFQAVVDPSKAGKYYVFSDVLGKPPASFIINADPVTLTYVRPHVLSELRDVMSLVDLLVRLESKRTSWINKTIHEVRHPLQGLVTMGSEVRSMLSDSQISRRDVINYAEDIETSIMRLRVLLTVFEHVSGLEDIEPEPKPSFVEADVLRPSRRLLAAHARRKRVTLQPTVGYGAIPRLDIDPDLLTLIAYNLLDNAIKYSPAGEVVRIECGNDDNSYYFQIKNKGPVIKEAEVKSIFDKEVRGENVEDDYPGLGLGLYLSQSIAVSLECKISLIREASIPSSEACFRISIPKRLKSDEVMQ